jgi:hypothetical protein
MAAARSITAPMMEAGSALPSLPMLLAISRGSTHRRRPVGHRGQSLFECIDLV